MCACVPRLKLLLCPLLALCFGSCQDNHRFSPVRGSVLVDGKPGEGVMVVFHPVEQTDPPLQPYAVVGADGTFSLQSWLADERTLKAGAPAGQYQVTCVWYPEDLAKYGAGEELPDKLRGKYANKDKS